jgi:hypothetical protein
MSADQPPGSIRTPHPAAALLIWLAVRPLPSGSRDRFQDEYRAEVCCLGSRQQVLEAASALAGSFALSRAIRENDMKMHTPQRRRLLCRLGRHDYRTIGAVNTENMRDRHKECTHCGKIKELDMYEPSNGRSLGGSGPLT